MDTRFAFAALWIVMGIVEMFVMDDFTSGLVCYGISTQYQLND